MKYIYIIIIALFAVNAHAQEEEITFTASAPDVVMAGDQFRLSYTITSQNEKDFFGPNEMTGFEILVGPTLSRNNVTQIVNGKVTSNSSMIYTYVLQALEEGEYTIPAATILTIDGAIDSNTVKIKVLPQDKTDIPETVSDSSTVSDDKLFIRAIINRNENSDREPITFIYKIYTQVDLKEWKPVSFPRVEGFHWQNVEDTKENLWVTENYDGKNYQTYKFLEYKLYPVKEGTFTVYPAVFDVYLVKPATADPFDAFFGGGENSVEIKKTVTTNPLTIEIKSLPKPTLPILFEKYDILN